jgi:Fur family transcriptional regulator, ferric uptake regulator
MDYHALLKTSGIRVTSHKLAILALLEQHKHLDAVQIAALAKDQQLDISLATVYRTLAVFESCNLITNRLAMN